MFANAATGGAPAPLGQPRHGHLGDDHMLELAAALWAGACLLAATTGGAGLRDELVLLAAAVAFAVGECFHSAALTPLVAELAPPGLRGRYTAAVGLSWWMGLALAPAVGAPVLAVWPAAALVGAAATAAVAGASVRLLDGALPEAARITPRPAGTA